MRPRHADERRHARGLRSGGVLLATLAALGSAGCKVGPDYATPDVALPRAFSSAGSRVLASSADLSRWWRLLDDPELDALVARAVRANPDIAIALARVQEAREREAATLGAALPLLAITGGIANGSGNETAKGRIPPSLDAGTFGRGLRSITQVGGFDAIWEFDLFGKYRRLLEATRRDTQAAIEARNAVLVSVIGEVARNYVLLRGLQTRLAVARDNITRARQTVELTQSRYAMGISDEYPVTLAKRELASLAAGLPVLTGSIADVESRIAVLLGTFSQDIDKELRQPAPIPRPPASVRPGRPLELLRRRPDIREAERQLAAATARIGVATADLFPRVFVLGGVGLQGGSAQGGNPAPYKGPIWSFGPGAYWPLLDFGRIDALIDATEFQTQGLLAGYRKTIIVAVEEVEQAIKQYLAELDRLKNLRTALDESRRAVQLAQERYDRGLTDFLNVLDAERQEYDLEDQYAAEQQAVAVQFVAVYKALGGGWELYQGLPPIPKPEPAIMATFHRLSEPHAVRPGRSPEAGGDHQ